jgi:hypothetical protein
MDISNDDPVYAMAVQLGLERVRQGARKELEALIADARALEDSDG